MAVFSRRIAPNVPRIIGRDPGDYARELQETLEYLLASNDNGLPPGAGNTDPSTIEPDATADPGDQTSGWAPIDHTHAIATDTTSDLGNAASEGTSDSFSRSDHVHKRAIETTNSGLVRRRLNFGPGFTVTDDAGSDEIEITLTPLPSDVEAFAWFMGT